MISIKKRDLANAMIKAQESYMLAGPVKDKQGHTFRQLQKGEPPDLDYKETRLSAKAVVFPQSEKMFTFIRDKKKQDCPGMEDILFDETPRAVVGIRPYDAKALNILKMNFDTEEIKDPYFIRRYETLTLVGLAENQPSRTNFSTSCGTGPFDETYLDILLVDTGDEYTGKILTQKGKKFAAAAGFVTTDTSLEGKIDQLKKAAEAKITSRVAFDTIEKANIIDLYEAPFWKDLAFSCINCGTCTFACPTCWCFDIQDEISGDNGIRLRLWDSCMSDLYSAHASGHNPRAEGWQRFRNRFMHKLKYFMDKYHQGIMCVGCGRCINSCPANIDIRKVCEILNREEAIK